MVTQMISVGESTGALDNMLEKIADFYDDEVDIAVGALTSMIEPILWFPWRHCRFYRSCDVSADI